MNCHIFVALVVFVFVMPAAAEYPADQPDEVGLFEDVSHLSGVVLEKVAKEAGFFDAALAECKTDPALVLSPRHLDFPGKADYLRGRAPAAFTRGSAYFSRMANAVGPRDACIAAGVSSEGLVELILLPKPRPER